MLQLKRENYAPVGVAFFIAIIGTILLVHSRAANPTVSVEPESGALVNAINVADSGASGGHAVKFGVGGAPNLAFGPSGAYGFGTANVLAYSPFKNSSNQRPLLMGIDIGGIYQSFDSAKNWAPSSSGLPSKKIASIVWSPSIAGKVYAATDNGLAVSTNFGKSWATRSGAIDQDSNGVWHLNGLEHPRSTGIMMAVADSGSTKYLWVANAAGGLKRSVDDGNTWDKTTFYDPVTPKRIRGIATDPSNPNILYVAVLQDGVYKSTDAEGAMTFTKLPGSAVDPEELSVINGTLYGVSDYEGVFSYDTSWHWLNNGLSTGTVAASSGPTWQSIAGYLDPVTAKNILYIGCSHCGSTATLDSMYRSLDGGANWTSLTTGSNVTVSKKLYGTTIDWWSTISYGTIADKSAVNTQIALDPDNTNKVLTGNVTGAWAAEIAGSQITWWPADVGTMITVNNVSLSDPKMPNRLYQLSMDITMLYSADHGASFKSVRTPGNPVWPTTGYALSFDTSTPAGSPSTVYATASYRDDNSPQGTLYSNSDPVATPDGWVDEQLPFAMNPTALGVGHDSSGNRVILVHVENHGLYRKVGANWSQQVTNASPFSAGFYGQIAFQPNSPVVYAHDNGGIWRSDQAGADGTWVKLTTSSTKYQNSAILVLDPTNIHRIYVVSDSITVNGISTSGVVRIDGADSPTPTFTKISSSTGPIAIDNRGALYAHSTGPVQLRYFPAPSSGNAPSYTDISDQFYKDNNGNIRYISVGSDGYVYAANNSSGGTIGAPH